MELIAHDLLQICTLCKCNFYGIDILQIYHIPRLYSIMHGLKDKENTYIKTDVYTKEEISFILLNEISLHLYRKQ